MRLARDIVGQFYGEAVAGETEAEFRMTYREHQEGEIIFLPDDAVDLGVPLGGRRTVRVNIAQELKVAGLVESVSDARRLIRQGAVELVGWSAPARPLLEKSIEMMASPQRVTEPQLDVEGGQVYRVGKHRFLRIVESDVT